MAQDYFLGDTIAELKGTAVNFVAERFTIEPQYVELAGCAMYMGLSFVFAGATQVVDVAKDVQKSVGKLERKIHKNSLEYVGDTHVYAIRKVADGKVHKIGESAQGVRKD